MMYFSKQRTAYVMSISDLSSDVCSSDLSQQRGALPLDHRNACGHVSSSKDLLPFVGLVKEDCERPKAAEIGACCFRLQIRPFVKETQMTREPYLIGYARVSKGEIGRAHV